MSTPSGVPPASKWVMQAIAQQERGAVDEAARLFRRALQANPTDWVALYSLGGILATQGQLDEALKLAERLAKVQPRNTRAHELHRKVLDKLGRLDDALSAAERSLQLEPRDLETLTRRADLLHRLGREEAAIAAYRDVLALDPDNLMCLAHLGMVLSSAERLSEAAPVLERLLQLNPRFPYGPGMLALARLKEADWRDHEALVELIAHEVRAGRPACRSMAMMALSYSAADQRLSARQFSQEHQLRRLGPFWQGERYQHGRIRLAYLSPDFRDHAVGHLMAGVIEQHDRSRFETIGVSVGPADGGALRQRFEKGFKHFIDAQALGHAELAVLLRRMEVDVLVDLAGFTKGARPELFASRVAPVQVNYLGYPGTLGSDSMDYILADRQVIGLDDLAHYDEQVVWLPDAYLPPAASLQVPLEATPTRAAAGLPEQGLVFCAFNLCYKITPGQFGAWMRILRAVPDSVLWLSSPSAAAMQRLREAAQAAGVDAGRLVFAPRMPRIEDHLARYRLADLFLDTTPYNAHTTASDALLLGLPVLTCRGQTFPSRVASSLLTAAGLPELVTHSLDDYVALAVALAQQPERLQALRARLQAARQAGGLFSTARHCRHLEVAFAAMHARAQAGEKPSAFAVQPQPCSG